MQDSIIPDQKPNHDVFEINNIDLIKTVKILGIQHANGKNAGGQNAESLIFDFFNQKIRFSQDDFHDIKDKPLTNAVKNVFYQYLLKCPDSICESSNKLVTLREFPDSGPLFSRFTANTNKIIETTFSGQLDNLKNQCFKLNGIIMSNASYDLSVRFKALSKVPIILNYNDKDDMMPASAVFLFHDNDANNFLDLKSLGTLLTYLTGQLIQQ
ncbi:MAG: DUF3786 domain-containing protein [Desulfobacteraceae bacterium]|nr:DUF3786 domain-containing protein [Desulfobacteraceae bacterium]